MKKVRFRIKEIMVNNKNTTPNKNIFLLLFKKLWKEFTIKKIINRTDKNINIELLNNAISLLPKKVAI